MLTIANFKLIKYIDNVYNKWHDKSLLFNLKNELIEVINRIVTYL